jgi:hypothetical protein
MYTIISHGIISQAAKSGLMPKNFSSKQISKIIGSGKLPKNFNSGNMSKILQKDQSKFFKGTGLAYIILSFIFGAIGIGYFIYGKKQHLIVAMLAGVALNVISFFVSGIFLLILTGIIIMVIPWFIRV